MTAAAAGTWLAALRGSLRGRLLLGTLVWILATLVIAGAGLGSLFRQQVALQFQAELTTHLDQLAGRLVLDAQGQPALSSPLSDPRLARPLSGLYWQVDRPAGALAPAARGLLRSRSLWDGVLAAPADGTAAGDVHSHRILGPEGSALVLVDRTLSLADGDGPPAVPLRLLVAADEQLMLAPVARFNRSLWLALAALGLGLIAAAVVQVAVGLTPLQRLRQALGDIRQGRTHRLEGRFPVEVTPLVDELNTVLAQNAEIVARARTQAGNLAHALKTPLTVLGNAAAAQPSVPSRLVDEQVALARRQIDYHLKRARVAGAAHRTAVHTPLRPAAEGLLRVMRKVHARDGLAWIAAPLDDRLVFGGEAQDLQEMLGNLLDNAGKWARQRVELGASQAPGRLIITVDDDGPGIAADRREAVLDRGTRDDEKVPGSGLGLAIVDDLARLYGGQVALAESPLGGLRVTLSLPAA